MLLKEPSGSLEKVEGRNDPYQLIALNDRKTTNAFLAHDLHRFQLTWSREQP